MGNESQRMVIGAQIYYNTLQYNILQKIHQL